MSEGAGSSSEILARRAGFAFLLFAPGLGLDALQRRAAATTALVATLWLTQAIPLGASSLLPAVLLPLLGVMPARDAASVYMDDLVLMFLGAFIVAIGLERWNVHKRMALFVIAHVGTRPRRLVLGFTLATVFVSMWINNTAATLMMYPIGMAVIATVCERDVIEHKKVSPFAISLLLGIAYGASIGGMATPVGTAPNQVFLGQLHTRFPSAPEVGFGPWIIGWLPVVAVFTLGMWWLSTRVVLRVEDGEPIAKDTIRNARAELGPMQRGEIMMAAVFSLTALLWVTREPIDLGALHVPGWSDWIASLQARGVEGKSAANYARYISDGTVALAMAIVCFVLPVDAKRGTFLIDWHTAAKLPWDVLLLFGGGFCIAKGFSASGLDQWFGSRLGPLLAGKPEWAIVAIVVTLMTFASELTSNVAITTLTLPILANTAVAGGINPLLLMAPATIAASSGFMLPVATPPNMIAFASRMIPMGRMARVGLAIDLLGILVITLGFHFWVRHVWQLTAALPSWAAH
jgi:sodium-dependent dicarboxylate transporter 2/3/5